ncbi:MAG: ribosome recycling factor [Thermodesulfobacteriota bacterium]
MVEEVMESLKSDMEKVISQLRKEYDRVRTGRASAALLEGIRVDYYGSSMPINQVANISIPEPRLITIQPWDKAVMGEIEKAIQRSELGLTPMNDGKVIRIAIPPLTEERRKELVKVVRKMAEERKVDLRNHRREANETLKELKKDKVITEDELFRYQEEVQKITDSYVERVDSLLQSKEKEILEI